MSGLWVNRKGCGDARPALNWQQTPIDQIVAAFLSFSSMYCTSAQLYMSCTNCLHNILSNAQSHHLVKLFVHFYLFLPNVENHLQGTESTLNSMFCTKPFAIDWYRDNVKEVQGGSVVHLVVLCWVVLSCVELCCVVLYCIVLCCIVLCFVVLYCQIPFQPLPLHIKAVKTGLQAFILMSDCHSAKGWRENEHHLDAANVFTCHSPYNW